MVVFSDLSLRPLLPCAGGQQCFATAAIPSGSAILGVSGCRVVALWRGICSLRMADWLRVLGRAAGARCGAGGGGLLAGARS